MSNKFNFDEIIDRTNTDSVKWNVKENELPMWIADMDFAAAPAAIEAMENSIKERVFGYKIVPQSWYESIKSWNKRRYDVDLDTSEIIFSTGVIPALRSCIRAFSNVGDGVVIFTPTYNNFFTSIDYNDRKIVSCELDYKDGKYEINWDNLEKALQKEENKIFLFCNPQNPIGMSYDYESLSHIAKLCQENDVYMFADEIHADLTHPGYRHYSANGIDKDLQDHLIVFNSVTKPFNLAGLKGSYVVIRDEKVRKYVERRFEADKVQENNHFVIDVMKACYSPEGEAWLDALNEYLEVNRKLLTSKVLEEFPEIKISPADSTYLAWLDLSHFTKDSAEFCEFLREKTGLVLNKGSIYGLDGKQFVRWNYASPKAMVEDSIQRFIKGMHAYIDEGKSLVK